MRYFVENTFENLTLIRTISDSFLGVDTHELFDSFKRYNTIILVAGEDSTPLFSFGYISQALVLSETKLRELVFTLSLEQ